MVKARSRQVAKHEIVEYTDPQHNPMIPHTVGDRGEKTGFYPYGKTQAQVLAERE